MTKNERDASPLQPFFTPESIEAQSFAIIDAEAPFPRPFAGEEWEIARRLVHTAGDFDILRHLTFRNDAVRVGVAALRRGALILTDTEMAKAGMPERRLTPLGARTRCILSLPKVAERAARNNWTRSRAAIEAARPYLPGCILAVGNAPTALLGLLEYLDAGGAPPALTIAMPVGFVNAAESKERILKRGLPAIAIAGRKGGSTLAAATVNALAVIALRKNSATP